MRLKNKNTKKPPRLREPHGLGRFEMQAVDERGNTTRTVHQSLTNPTKLSKPCTTPGAFGCFAISAMLSPLYTPNSSLREKRQGRDVRHDIESQVRDGERARFFSRVWYLAHVLWEAGQGGGVGNIP